MASRRQLEFGDFQTPPELATEVCRRLRRFRLQPTSIVEPTCGKGFFLEQAVRAFPASRQLLGCDISADHLREARRRVAPFVAERSGKLLRRDFFSVDWPQTLAALPDPLLVIGNPPWINSARMTDVGGDNRPTRSNDEQLPGLAAMTGKSNFDISEWMLRRLVESLDGRRATLAMLCKLSTARKVLRHAWQENRKLNADLFRIDARKHFQAAVDACLLVCRFGLPRQRGGCRVYDTLSAAQPATTIGFHHGRLVADLDAYRRCRQLISTTSGAWRSGIKHDCAQVFELQAASGRFQNGLGQLIDLEDACVFPLLKGAQLSRGSTAPARWLLVTQRAVNEDTQRLQQTAQKTWRYLNEHGARLDQRRSAIYRGRCRFAMFGVGPYTFAPWKVAVSGLHKRVRFVKVGCHQHKPFVLDDTCYFLPCDSESVAQRRWEQLQHPLVQDFFSAFTFSDAKRAITAEILNSLDLDRL